MDEYRVCQSPYCINDISHRPPNSKYCCDKCRIYPIRCLDCGAPITKEARLCKRCANLGARNHNWKRSFSDETLAKMRKARRERVISLETRQKVSNTLKGRKRSAKTRAKISESKRKRAAILRTLAKE